MIWCNKLNDFNTISSFSESRTNLSTIGKDLSNKSKDKYCYLAIYLKSKKYSFVKIRPFRLITEEDLK